MVNWQDPIVITQGYFDLLKFTHVLTGIYIWEMVVTAGFELNVLRGKLPYRPTIWLYLGTRYTALLVFIIFLIRADGTTKVSCRFAILDDALGYASWAFASLLIALRVIAIWDRNIFVSSLVIGPWFVGLVLYIYTLANLRTSYDPFLGMCLNSNTRRFLVNAVSMLVIDIVLLMSMIVGLVRSPHGRSFSLWHLLFQQSIVWLVLVTISDLPLMVLLILNLNNPMNEMFAEVTAVVVSIGAARIYRALFQHTLSTSYKPRQGSPGMHGLNPSHTASNVLTTIPFAPSTQSRKAVTTSGAVAVSMQPETLEEHIQSDFSPGTFTTPEPMHQNTDDRVI